MRTYLILLTLFSIISGCSKKEPGVDKITKIYTASISGVDQQVVKGWGCCPIWIGNHDVSTQPLTIEATFNMGETIIRLSQLPDMGDDSGRLSFPRTDWLCRAIKITADKGMPYILSSWSPPAYMKTIKMDGSVVHDSLAYLQPAHEQDYCNFIVKLLDYISKDKGLPLPLFYSFQNEPTCQTPWAGCIYESQQYKRVALLLRNTLDANGYGAIKMLGTEDGGYNNGQGWNSSVGLFGGSGFPLLSDSIYNNCISAFASHSYDWSPNTSLGSYNDWINGCDAFNKDRWQTEYCYIEDTLSPHAVGTVRRFISDMAFLKNNYWFTWTVNEGWGHNVPDALCFGDGVNSLTMKPAYYALKKLFSSIPPGSKVRRMTTDDADLVTGNAGRMDMVAFASDTNMVAVIVNPTSAVKKTNLSGLTGSAAQIFQIALNTNNTDMTRLAVQPITSGTIQKLQLPVNSISIIISSHTKS